jgi:carboxyl-terminal processing protease
MPVIRSRVIRSLQTVAALMALPAFAADDAATRLETNVKHLIEVYATVEDQAADPVTPAQAFFQGAIPGMLRTLDPHSSFFEPEQFQQLQQMQRGEQKGFGSIVNVLPGRVLVLQSMEGSPSAKAGLSAGDEMVAINGIPLSRLAFEQLIQLLTEARQQQVSIDIRRPGNARLMTITMSPALVDSPSVDRSFFLAPDVGYVHVTAFEDPTADLIRQVIEKLGGENLKSLVLDLRDNPGGSVEAAIRTAALFLSPGQLIFSVKGRKTNNEELKVPDLARPYTFPVAVLVNGKTASASEIVTGALQDHDRALVIGEPSYGKGLVQQVYPLSASAGLALTTAFYFTPSGRSIQKPLQEGQLGATLRSGDAAPQGVFRTDSGRLVRGGGGIQPDTVVPPRPVTRLEAVLDATALLTTFAGDYVRAHEVTEQFQVAPALLDELHVFLSEHSIQPSVAEWLSERDWIQSRLLQELYTLKFGVAKGDEVEMQRDPVTQTAIMRLRGEP